MKSTYVLLFFSFLLLIYAGSNINKNRKKSQLEFYQLLPEEKQKIITEDSIKTAKEDNEYYRNLVLEKVPITENETDELIKYRKDLAQWYEWDNECMGMDPHSKPKDPRKHGK